MNLMLVSFQFLNVAHKFNQIFILPFLAHQIMSIRAQRSGMVVPWPYGCFYVGREFLGYFCKFIGTWIQQWVPPCLQGSFSHTETAILHTLWLSCWLRSICFPLWTCLHKFPNEAMKQFAFRVPCSRHSTVSSYYHCVVTLSSYQMLQSKIPSALPLLNFPLFHPSVLNKSP